MARKMYKLNIGMQEHPETFAERGVKPTGSYGPDDHQLLFAGDVFEVEENLIMRHPDMGGWIQPTDWTKEDHNPRSYALVVASPVPSKEEKYVIRDEPAKVVGYNITIEEVEAQEKAAEAAEATGAGSSSRKRPVRG